MNSSSSRLSTGCHFHSECSSLIRDPAESTNPFILQVNFRPGFYSVRNRFFYMVYTTHVVWLYDSSGFFPQLSYYRLFEVFPCFDLPPPHSQRFGYNSLEAFLFRIKSLSLSKQMPAFYFVNLIFTYVSLTIRVLQVPAL